MSADHDETIISLARAVAERAHEGQVRKFSGDPYFIHAGRVAERVADYTDDPELIAAAYLHDTIEDAGMTDGELEKQFGQRVANIVRSLTNDREQIMAMGKTAYMTSKWRSLPPDALLIKMCDTLDNMLDSPTPAMAARYMEILEGVRDRLDGMALSSGRNVYAELAGRIRKAFDELA